MNTKYIRLSILLLCFFCIRASAQNVINGKVFNSANNTAIPGANIYIEDLKMGTVCDSAGNFSLNNIPGGTYIVTVHALGYGTKSEQVTMGGNALHEFGLSESSYPVPGVVVTGNSLATEATQNPQQIAQVSHEYLAENSSTNVIDAIATIPGVAAMTDGQSISKPIIRGLGYNRVLTVNDGVIQVDQVWFDEFGIEADPDAVDRVEILKGPASLAYGSDAIAGVVNLIPERNLPEGQIKGEVMNQYQTNNGLINNMVHIAGMNDGISWSARIDNTMAHAYQNAYDGYVLNSQFSNFNMDGSIGIHRKWGYSQLKVTYFDMATGIVDGTRDSATGQMVKAVAYPDLNGGAASYELPTYQEQTSYTPLVINQRIRHTKIVWDNSIAVGQGRITGIFSYQKNQRQETNDPTMPNTPDIYYSSNAATYDLRYVSRQMGGFNYSAGVNGMYQASQSLGTLMLIPNYNILQGGAFVIANQKLGNLNLSGGIRYDTRTFQGVDHWVDSLQTPVAPNTPDGIHEFQGFTSSFNGLSGSLGATYKIDRNFYVKGNVARGYRAPNVAECAANGVHDGTVVWEIGDNTLKPEASLEEDLTFGMNSKDLGFEIDVFNNSISNFIYAQGLQSALGGDSINNSFNLAGLGDAPVYKYTQGNAQLYGGEVVLNIHPAVAPWIELNTSFSTVSGGLTGVPDSVKVLPFIPPSRLTADLKFKVKGIGRSVRNAYVKFGMIDCFQQNQVYLQEAAKTGLSTDQTPFEFAASQAATPGYVLFNAGIGASLQGKGRTFAKIYISANNILNTVYMDYLSRFKYYPVNYTRDRVGVFNMGRNISLKLIIPIDIKG
jgi:iron complex outermembrane recepter protein